MPTSLFQYEMLPTTWFYLSSIIIIATFFKFNRFWSVRNLDLIGLIFSSPGLVFLAMGDEYHGFIWLFTVGALFFVRLLFDQFMVRRPLLDPNVTSSGLIFGLVTLLVFLIPNLIMNRGEAIDSDRTLRLEQILSIKNAENADSSVLLSGPGYRPFQRLVHRTNQLFIPPAEIQREILHTFIPDNAYTVPLNTAPFVPGFLLPKYASAVPGANRSTVPVNDSNGLFADGIADPMEAPLGNSATDVQSFNRILEEQEAQNARSSQSFLSDNMLILTLVSLAQFGIVFAMMMIGHCHFGNFKSGAAAALLYMLLPYTNQMAGSIGHFLPGMLLILAVLIYRRPVFSGFLIGLAGSLVFYPFFLLPLWYGYYWKRGTHRFTIGLVSAVLLMGLLLLFSPAENGTYAEQLGAMFGCHSFRVTNPNGIWTWLPAYYRIPIIALYLTVAFGLAIWPPQKNLATLISCSALLMLGVQFWIGTDGGLYAGWYLPLLILTIFRPNLEDRVASSMVIEV